MSFPNYLAKIKSSGMYRFTFDKSQVSPVAAETLRLVVGYSDKGPFNSPVYITTKQEFINLFGNINKRLEKKGVFFHRLALQALSTGPILALNLKPFTDGSGDGTAEQVNYLTFNPCDVVAGEAIPTSNLDVRDLFDRDRFWSIDANNLPHKINLKLKGSDDNRLNKYINIAATDIKDTSCSIFIRKCHDNSVKAYNTTVRDWYKNTGEEMPEYLNGYEDTLMKDFFAEIYVFKGVFSDNLKINNGPLRHYFNKDNLEVLTTEYKNAFGVNADALAALASDESSNLVGIYRGCLLPFFRDFNGVYQSLDMLFNADSDTHKMIMKLDDNLIDTILEANENGHNELTHWAGGTGWLGSNPDVNSALKPTYVSGYEYGTINRHSSPADIQIKSLNMLFEKGIFEALTNNVDSEYHYIIDTFATLVSNYKAITSLGEVKVSSIKHNIATVAKKKDNCLAIMNAPAMADWKKINNFNMKDLEKGSYEEYFSLPSDANGASYCAYYTPLVFGEGLVKTNIPSAALVSNNFMLKWTIRQPYYIVAGPNYGVMSYDGMIGPDYNYSRDDLDVFEPMGINCMVYVPRKGTYINSNQTAKQTPISALSKVHVRELVIYIQNEIEKLMQNYQWELNTSALRDKIKTSADAILNRVMINGGVYAFVNICDATNNTPDVIDNEMIILDTAIEPARGAGKMVQRLTIHKTGGITSTAN
jgi:hypothetical protein